ncbi:MAG: hypothetical protein J2P28_09570 [Actinobacteria bacterium]|nr:hypothetical protein [Actinomycetota bacterium]
MSNNSRGGSGLRPRRLARPAALITVIASAALLAAACSDSPSSTRTSGSTASGGSANSSTGVAYSQCVRSHGVPNFPDPDSNGQIPKEAAVRALREVSDSVAKSASGACANLNPAGQGPTTLTTQQQQDYLRAAACMRSHGITNFPDPTFSGGSVHFAFPSSIDTSSARFAQAQQICVRLIPAGLPYSGSGSGS